MIFHVIPFLLWESAKSLIFFSVIFKTLHLNVFSVFHQHIVFASSSLVKTLININLETEPWRTLFITSLHPGVISFTFVLSSASRFLSQHRSLLMVFSAAQYLWSYRTIDTFPLSEKSILSRKDIRYTLLINLWVLNLFFFHFSPYLSLSLPLKSILMPYTPLRLQQRSTRITETTAMTQRSTDYFPIFSENDTCSTQTAPPLNVKMSLIPLLQILYLHLSFWLEHPWVSACFLSCFCCNSTQFNWWHSLHLFGLHQPSFGRHIKNIHWVMHGAKSLLLIPSASMRKSCQRLVMVRLRTHLNSLNTGL